MYVDQTDSETKKKPEKTNELGLLQQEREERTKKQRKAREELRKDSLNSTVDLPLIRFLLLLLFLLCNFF
jgi:hypothetical protein